MTHPEASTTTTASVPNAWAKPLDASHLSNDPVSLDGSLHPVIVAPIESNAELGLQHSNAPSDHQDLLSSSTLTQQDNQPKAPSVPRSEAQSSGSCSKKVIVLDSGAIITSASFAKHFLNHDVEFVTTASVIQEIKSSKARATLNSLPFTLKIQNVWLDSLKEVKKYAERTGDYTFLSSVDLEVLALTYQLELRDHGKKNLKDLPQKLDFGGKLMFKANLTPYPGTEKESSTPTDSAPASENNNGFNAGADASWGYFEDANNDDGWITEENIKEHHDEFVGKESEWIVPNQSVTSGQQLETQQSTTSSEQSKSRDSKFQSAFQDTASNVGCITTDYAMQNVLVQMGLNLISVEGRRILTLRRYVLRCTACRVVVPDTSRVFCPNCGNHSTLKRVECVVDENGEATFYYNPNYKFNLKGTNYQIPKPKGGQKAVDPIIREDQMLSVRRGIKKKQIKPSSSRGEDLFSREYSIEGVFDLKSKKQSHWDTKDKLITGKPKPPPRKHKKKKRN